jgi:putative endonuclease
MRPCQGRETGAIPVTRSKFLFMFYVYILKSLKDNDLYVGFSTNLKRRIEEHMAGKNFSTKWRRPFKLIYYEAYLSENDAKNREKFFKTGWGRNYIKRNLPETIKV